MSEPKRARKAPAHILVVGSINVDLYQRLDKGAAKFAGKSLSIKPIKGMTLPAANFLSIPAVGDACAEIGMQCAPGDEEKLVLTMDGPFEQKTGGKGANAAAAAGQSFTCEFIGNFGAASAEENKALLADLKTYGDVDISRCATLAGTPTGTAYILLFDDNDNAIVLLGGANQKWPTAEELKTGTKGESLRSAITQSACVMLQREVPDHVNLVVAEIACSVGKPVFMDVGGTDVPLDERLLPFITVVAPNESELTFIAGVATHGDDGKVDPAKVRQAVSTLKGKLAAAGNRDAEVLVTLGAMGSLHFPGKWSIDGGGEDECYMGTFSLATPDGKPRDTTGAGDCFRGSYVAARYGEQKSIADSMRWAAAAGSLSVEVEGAMPSMPSRAKIEERASMPLSCHESF